MKACAAGWVLGAVLFAAVPAFAQAPAAAPVEAPAAPVEAPAAAENPYVFTQGDITVEYPWARRALAGLDTVVFLTIENRGEPDRLTGVETVAGYNAELVDILLTGRGFRLIPIGPVDVPAGTLRLEGPEGEAIALRNVFTDLEINSTVALTLTFAKAGVMTVQVLVQHEDAVRHGHAPD